MAYFRCTLGGGGAKLEVTCDSEFAGEIISCTKNSKVLQQVCPSTSPYKVTFTIPESGTWTISATVDGTTYSQTVVVVIDYTADLEYGFNWQRWAEVGGADPSDYDDLDELLADEETVRMLFIKHVSVDYLCQGDVITADLETIINNDLCAKWINLSDYALDTMYANAAIKDVMDEADKYGYGEWALMPQVPAMASNTNPYGTVSASSTTSGYDAWKAFDASGSGPWIATSKTNQWVRYQFVKPVCIKQFYLAPVDGTSSSNCRVKNYKIQASNDGSTWVDIYSGTYVPNTIGSETKLVTNNDSYSYAQILIIDGYSTSSSGYAGVGTLQFYAWAPKGNVPVMTSNTAPYGTAYASNVLTTGYEAYKVFDNDPATSWAAQSSSTAAYVGYIFANPVCLKRVKRYGFTWNAAGDSEANRFQYRIKYTDDGSTWTNLSDTWTNFSTKLGSNQWDDISVNNNAYHLGWAMEIHCKSGAASTWNTASLQFYGRELSASVPTMTSNTAPYGEVIYSSQTNAYEAYKAFDGNSSSQWIPNEYVNYSWVGYHFNNPVCVKQAYIFGRSGVTTRYKIQASNTGGANDWTDLTSLRDVASVNESVTINNSQTYSYYRFIGVLTDTTKLVNISTLQFYGLDYSEKEFEVGATKKWLYDHGVELEPVSVSSTTTSTSKTEKRSSELYVKCLNANSTRARFKFNTFDMSDYSLLRYRVGSEAYASSAVSRGTVWIFDSAESTSIGSASVSATDSNIPNNKSLDVSMYNQVVTVTLDCSNGIANAQTGTTTAERVLTCKELWVE